jgi:cell shape-determining protein MreC
VGGATLGVVDGRGAEPLRFDPLDPRVPVAEGDEVVTATFPGSAVPAGIPIGRVASLEVGGSRLTRVYDVRPFVDIVRLDHVLVVLSSPQPEVPPFEDSDGLRIPVPVPSPDPDAQGEDPTAGPGGQG